MGTVLMWRACRITQTFYGHTLAYKHKVTLDGEHKQFMVESRDRCLIPFWISFLPILIEFLCSVSIVYEFLRGNPLITPSIAVCYIFTASLATIIIGLNVVSIRNANGLYNHYCNSLLRFDSQLHRNGRPVTSGLATFRLVFQGNYFFMSSVDIPQK